MMVSPFIEGAACDSRSESSLQVINPSNGRSVFEIPEGCEADVNTAVQSAVNAFGDGRWKDTSPSRKQRTLLRFAELIRENSEALDELDAVEMGKPISLEFGNAEFAAGTVQFYAEALDKLQGEVLSSDKESFVAHRRVPRGVVAAVAPWNFPTVNAVLKVAPALAAGNCVILKPSELSSSSAVRLAQLALEAGVPAGVFNVVPGRGEIVGSALGLHNDVDMISFTGSTEVGRRMLQYSGKSNMKVVLAECGGKSPHIVFSDIPDIEGVGRSIGQGLLINQGQLCSVGSRVLVQRSIEKELLRTIVASWDKVSIGNACDRRTTFGPLVSAAQCKRVLGFVETAKSEGAELVAGGHRVMQDTGGYFVGPTAFRKVLLSMQIAQEEVFGPVLSVTTFDEEDEAIRIANGTKYGLAAYVWTSSLSRGMRLSKALRSPVWINSTAATGEGAGHAASFEPAGQSGVGVEGGLAGLESYMRRQLVWINHD